MSRLTTIKINRYITAYVSECARDTVYSGLYEGNSITRFGTAFKNIALCALDKANEGQSGTNKINKQEFYCCLFCMGFPLGLIAKTLLNANLAPVRNAVMKYKNQVIVYLKNQISESFVTYFSNSIESIRINATSVFLINIVDYCGYVGGLGLIDKLIGALDVQSLFLSVNEIGFKNPFARGGFTVQLSNLRSVWERTNGSRRGQVRRTGLTTSRVAQATTQIPARPNAAQGVTPSALPQAQNISAPAQAQTPVRDIEFTNTLGVEIEIVRPTNMTHTEFINGLVKELKKAGIDVQAVGYTHQTTSYWKITSDGSIETKQGIRSREAGCEIVTSILKGKRGLAELKKGIAAIRRAGGSINQSVGVHVHFGANGLQLDHWKNVLYNYAGFEPYINKTLYKTRRNSIWAKLISRISNLTNNIDRSNNFVELGTNVFGVVPMATESSYRSEGRYYTVNLYAFLRHGTIEFRQLQGSVEEDTILYWIYLLHFIIEVSKRKRLSYFDEKQIRNITPLWLSTWLGNRAFDMSDDNYNAV